jgi:hypothetical protein
MVKDTKNYKDLQTVLFDEWRKVRKGFVADGLVDENVYSNSKHRTVFVLKEVNSPGDENWDLAAESLKYGAQGGTWSNVARWVHGIRHLPEDIDWVEKYESTSKEFRANELRYASYINLKKSPGKGSSNISKLDRIAHEDSEFILKQIRLYDPQLVVCGGTGDILYELLNMKNSWKQTRRGVYFFMMDGRIPVIGMPHPAARINANFMHYVLIDAVREIL